MHLPGEITYKEIDEMITTVDKNEDWKISYSEFRVSQIIHLISILYPSSMILQKSIDNLFTKVHFP